MDSQSNSSIENLNGEADENAYRELYHYEKLTNMGYDYAKNGDIKNADIYYDLAVQEGYIRALSYKFALHLQYGQDDLKKILRECYDNNCYIVMEYIKSFDETDKNSKEVLHDLINLSDKELKLYCNTVLCKNEILYNSRKYYNSMTAFSEKYIYQFLYSSSEEGKPVSYYRVYERKINKEEFLYLGYISL